MIIPAPYWVSYPDIVNFAGGTPVIISAGANQALQDHARAARGGDHAEDAWVLLNSPSNPTGAAYSGEELLALGRSAAPPSACVIMTDDMYEHIV